MKVILVDDEKLAIDYLERQLAKIGNIDVIGKYMNPNVAMENLIQQEVDIVFLDIQLPEINGLKLAEKILEEKPDVLIVFVTAYNEFAVQAFELNALDYLVKPIQMDRLVKTITRLEQYLSVRQPPAPKETLLQINIGSQVTVGTEILQWRTTKAQELFLFLLQYRGNQIRKSSIVELLWPEMEPEKAYSQLYTTIYHIRKTLKKYQDHLKIQNSAEGYTFHTQYIVINLEEWERGIQEAPPLTLKTIEHYGNLMMLNSEIYLQHYDYLWAETERQRLEQLWLKTAFQIAHYYRENGIFEQAITWYLEIVKRQPEAEEAYFSLMKIYSAKENHLMVMRQYEELKKVLEEGLDVLPSGYITKWYSEWKKKDGDS